MNVARVRKAIAAGVGATIAAIVPALINGDQPATPEGWGALIGGAIALGIVTGLATYRVRNAGTVGGSDPVADLGTVASYRPGRSSGITQSGDSSAVWGDDLGTDGRGGSGVR